MRSSERRQNHVQTVLDSADIVRERIYQHQFWAAASRLGKAYYASHQRCKKSTVKSVMSSS